MTLLLVVLAMAVVVWVVLAALAELRQALRASEAQASSRPSAGLAAGESSLPGTNLARAAIPSESREDACPPPALLEREQSAGTELADSPPGDGTASAPTRPKPSRAASKQTGRKASRGGRR